MEVLLSWMGAWKAGQAGALVVWGHSQGNSVCAMFRDWDANLLAAARTQLRRALSGLYAVPLAHVLRVLVPTVCDWADLWLSNFSVQPLAWKALGPSSHRPASGDLQCNT
jgi:hypothetical protein